MNPIEKLISFIAPENCIECNLENYLLCPGCYHSIAKLGSICYICQKATSNYQPCITHKTKTAPDMVFCINKYEGKIKEYLLQYKFKTKRSAGLEIAKYINEDLPQIPDDYLVTWVPTSSKRIRQNGYDHSYLIAKNLAKLRKLHYQKLIVRVNNQPLHSLNKKERLQSIKKFYKINNLSQIKERKILLIDDIATTGVTIKYITKILKKAGAKEVIGCVFAKTF